MQFSHHCIASCVVSAATATISVLCFNGVFMTLTPLELLKAIGWAHMTITSSAAVSVPEVSEIELLQLLSDRERSYYMKHSNRIEVFPYLATSDARSEGDALLARFTDGWHVFYIRRNGTAGFSKP